MHLLVEFTDHKSKRLILRSQLEFFLWLGFILFGPNDRNAKENLSDFLNFSAGQKVKADSHGSVWSAGADR